MVYLYLLLPIITTFVIIIKKLCVEYYTYYYFSRLCLVLITILKSQNLFSDKVWLILVQVSLIDIDLKGVSRQNLVL